MKGAFNSNAVMEALKERSMIEELVMKYEWQLNQINTWEKELLSKPDMVYVWNYHKITS